MMGELGAYLTYGKVISFPQLSRGCGVADDAILKSLIKIDCASLVQLVKRTQWTFLMCIVMVYFMWIYLKN